MPLRGKRLPFERRLLRVRGTVQGVGFRPFIYRLARSHGLGGWVSNDVAGVTIEVHGDAAALDTFVAGVVVEAPPAARIEGVETLERGVVTAGAFAGFTIALSEAGEGGAVTAVSPDLPICDDCLREMRDPSDRRFGYPFINCTNCGPRFSIIEALPYDRPLTTMRAFPMCAACSAEYHDPLDRRFHAQPIACPECGPRVHAVPSGVLQGPQGVALWSPALARVGCWGAEAVVEAVRALQAGSVLALKGLGGYHLACDARNAAAVAALRERKFRKEKPFALMARDEAALVGVVELSEVGRAELRSIARPIVLLPKGPLELPAALAPDHAEYGVMLPYTPLQHLLFDAGAPELLVMTSANRSSEPIEYRDQEALERLAPLADLFVLGERPIARRIDDGVVQIIGAERAIVRRARGHAPDPILHDPRFNTPRIALGAELKSAIALAVDGRVMLSHHLGDLTDLASLEAFEEAVFDLCAMFRLDARQLPMVHDLHPRYASSRFAERLGGPRSVVQHHHAHIASVMVEHGAWSERVLGFAFDGAGLGFDHSVWGGELLLGSIEQGFERVGHLREAYLPGGDAAARNPRQAAVGFLEALGDEVFERLRHPPFDFDAARMRLQRQLIHNGLNAPRTTSMGRLFDSVAALVGFSRPLSFEGQAAIALESLARRADVGDARTNAYPWPFEAGVFDHAPLLQAVITDLAAGVAPERVARRFHEALAQGVATAYALVASQQLLSQRPLTGVAFSGGVFHNRLLLESLLERFAAVGVRVFRHSAVPAGDGGVALGQLALAAVGGAQALDR